MPTISNKKKKFIKRNFKHLSIEKLVHQSGLQPKVVKSLISEYTTGAEGKDQAPRQMNDKDSHVMRPLHLIVGVVISLLTCFVYAPALKNGFVWDDITYIPSNSLIHTLDMHHFYKMLTTFYASNWHPLTWLSHALDYALWGLEPFGHHLTNIILHGLNTFLVFFLVIQLISRVRVLNEVPSTPEMPLSTSIKSLIVATVTALLFGLHPLHVESVAWLAERKDLLCAFFSLLSISFYLSYTSSVVERHRCILFVSCLLLFIFALMSKPMAISLPIILLLLDIYPLHRLGHSPVKNLSIIWEKIPFFMLSIASGIITIMAQHSGRAIASLELWNLDSRLLNALRSLLFYLEKMIVPLKLVPFYPFPLHTHWLELQYFLSWTLVLTITGLCVWLAKQRKYLFPVIWSFYVITLFPVLGIIQVGSQAAADRYTYLPSIGIFLLAGIGMLSVMERSSLIKYKSLLTGLVVILFSAIMFLFGQLTIKQIKIWHNPESLWGCVIEAFPEKVPNAYYNLGLYYGKQGRLDESINQFKEALSIDPDHANAHNNLGRAYDGKGMLDEAISEWNKALAIDPQLAEAHNNLGTALKKKGMLDEAISEYKKALIIKSDFAEANYNLSVAYYYKQDYKLAIAYCDKAVELGYSVYPILLELLKPHRLTQNLQ